MGTCIHPEYDASRSKTNKSLCRHFRRQRRNKITVWLCLPLLMNRLNQITPRQSKENRNNDTTSERNPKAQTKVRAQNFRLPRRLAGHRSQQQHTQKLSHTKRPRPANRRKSKEHYCLAVAYIYEQEHEICKRLSWSPKSLCVAPVVCTRLVRTCGF